ncbi:MAG TPA: hypothetical protein VF198_12985 [Vicinamibacterales bacterium]
MRARWMAPALVAALMVATTACGKSEQEKKAEEAAAQLEAAAKDMEAGAAEFAKGLEAMAKGLAGEGETVEPVSFKELQAALPDLPGWEKGKPTGERMTSPVPYSQTEVRYTNGDTAIEVRIVDSGFQQLLLAPYTMFLTAGYEKETESGYEKSTRIGGHPGWEKWDADDRRGEVNAVVGKRFLVQAEGSNLTDIKVLQDAIAQIDFAKLASLQ